MIHKLADCQAQIPESTNIWQFCVVLPGAKIGENAMIGIGSVVTHDVPAGEVWVGNPAHFLKKVSD